MLLLFACNKTPCYVNFKGYIKKLKIDPILVAASSQNLIVIRLFTEIEQLDRVRN
jgi:hypothetical protein